VLHVDNGGGERGDGGGLRAQECEAVLAWAVAACAAVVPVVDDALERY
jgi:hypothetical protein